MIEKKGPHEVSNVDQAGAIVLIRHGRPASALGKIHPLVRVSKPRKLQVREYRSSKSYKLRVKDPDS